MRVWIVVCKQLEVHVSTLTDPEGSGSSVMWPLILERWVD